ncbi:flavin-dependent monooxygenase [Nocardioides albidus]|uniref:Flavin-dependent monooxygenase n=1 Tax=Nocardioides albidus TaxID=1517589 RepID=A0A5C4WRP1_9ACTN|nr:flavin-dependent monooxygenase [Nocardioides albidus]TNM50847.1 flavin-dependent monooxygenase [Nocardioides albidus]
MSEDILDPIRALLPGVREDAVKVEALRTIPQETMRALVGTGLLRTFQPRALGGAEGDPAAFFAGIRLLSSGCGSVGWTASLMGTTAWHVALLEEQAHDEVWGDDPDALVTSSYAPLGRLVPDEAGYRLSGTWNSVVGADLADWMMLGSQVIGRSGEPIDYAAVLLPRSEVEVGEAWGAVGLRGTGTRAVTVEETHVPLHRVYATARRSTLVEALRAPTAPALYRVPYAAIYSTSITAPLLGAAEGAYAYYTERSRQRSRLSLGARSGEDPSTSLAIARGLNELDASVLQIERDLRELHACALHNEPVPIELRLRARRDQVLSTERAVDAIELLLRAAGGHGVQGSTPILRAWRDIHTGAAHLVNNVGQGAGLYGRWALGFGVDDTLVSV